MLSLQALLSQTVTDLPVEAWWVPALVLVILGAAALVDALTSRVPDPLIFLGLVAVTALQGFYVAWPYAAQQLAVAMAAALFIWLVNLIWFRLLKTDAIGMGDAKWTMLAVAGFTLPPVLFAWGGGACLALIWLGVMRVTRMKIRRVYFAPFLFIGLIAGLYWLRLRG